jgi:hypothetical protein
MSFKAAVLLVVALLSLSSRPPLVAALSACPIRYYQLRLPPLSDIPRSFVTAEHAASDKFLKATRGYTLPNMTVLLTDSFGNIEYDISSQRGLQVRLSGTKLNSPTADNNVILTSVVAPVIAGRVTFAGVRINNAPSQFRFRFDAERVVKDDGLFNDPVTHSEGLWTGKFELAPDVIDVDHIDFYAPRSRLLTYPGQPVLAAVSGRALPPIAVAIFNSIGEVYRTSTGATNYTIIAAFNGSTSAYLLGDVVQEVRGVAVFDNLTIVTTASEGELLPPIKFTLLLTATSSAPVVVGEALLTGSVTMSLLYDNHFIAFEAEDNSLVYYDTQTVTGVGAVGDLLVFQPIRVSLRNTLMQRSPATTGLVITASIDAAQLTGSVTGVVDGVAVFDKLTVKGQFPETHPYVITLTANKFGDAKAAGKQLRFVAMLSTSSQPPYRLRFTPTSAYSFFTRRDQNALITNNQIKRPVRVEVLQTDNSLASNVTFIVTVALWSSRDGTQTIGTATTQGGVATFYTIDLPRSRDTTSIWQLLFTAPGMDELATGTLTKTPGIQNYDLAFASGGISLFTLPDDPSFATVNVAMPPIVVQIINSAGDLDTSSSLITITASVDGGARLSGGYVRVAKGVAVFDALTFVSDTAGTFTITFTAGGDGTDEVDPPAVIGKTLVTGAVEVVTTITENYRPQFVPSLSFVKYTGQVRAFTLGAPMPNLAVALVSSAHVFPNASIRVEHPTLVMRVVVTGGFILPNLTTEFIVPIIDSVAIVANLSLANATTPTIQFCVVGTTAVGNALPAAGSCVQTGALSAQINRLPIASIELIDDGVSVLKPGHGTVNINRGAKLTARLAAYDSNGARATTLGNDVQVTATSSFSLVNAGVKATAGEFIFNALTFSGENVGQGVQPYIKFTLDGTSKESKAVVQPVTSGLIVVKNPASSSGGVEVVVEILRDYATFDASLWLSQVATMLNIEPARLTQLYVFTGRSGPDHAHFDPVEANYVSAVWEGVRLEFMFLPPLPTSRDTRTALELATLFTSLQPSCKLGDLNIRRMFQKSTDETCDWLIFDSQMNGIRACLQARKKIGFCGCHVPLFATMAVRCLGLQRLSNLCLDVLIAAGAANCKQPDIVRVCSMLQYPDAPRAELMISGMVLLAFFPFLAYGYFKDFFSRLSRPPKTTLRALPTTSPDDIL